MRVLLIGAGGYVGVRVAERLRGEPGLEWSRSTLDLNEPRSFERMLGFDVALNVSDTLAAPPDRAIGFAVAHGLAWLEAGADGGLFRRLWSARPVGPGSVVLGVGLFPGLSNLLLREVWRPGGAPPELAVRVSPLSGAGRGTCELMVRLAGGIRAGKRFEFRVGSRSAYRVDLADGVLASLSLGLPVETFLAPAPALLGPLFRVPTPAPLLRLGLRLLRTVLLRSRASSVELLARAGGASRSLSVEDGMDSVSDAAVALLGLFRDRGLPEAGLRCIDQVCALEDVVSRMRRAPVLS